MNEAQVLVTLIDDLNALRAEMVREEAALEARMGAICAVHREGARNLAHYIALRRNDIRDLQEKLIANGLSSLGRAEADVLGAVDAVLKVLRILVGEQKIADPSKNTAYEMSCHGWALLESNTDALLGSPPRNRNVRIMVTMPSEAASDFGLVRDLLLTGMDCMRIHFSHGQPTQQRF